MRVIPLGMIVAAMASMAGSTAAQDRWETFEHAATERQGAYICDARDPSQGGFFCVELACSPDQPLAVEISRSGAWLAEELEAQFVINGAVRGVHQFAQSVPGTASSYRSEAAAQDDTLRYWLLNGRAIDLRVGDAEQRLSLSGSSLALRDVLAACPIG